MTLTRAVWRFRLAATCVALVALAFVQSPGETAADTKLDLTQNPGGFLSRALHLWDAQAFFGQLQNQAYGYVFPIGPYFWLGHELGVAGWVLQRLWWGVLLSTAFLGAVRLGRLLGLGPLARWTAAVAFALSPRLMSTLGPVSVESWPYALAPWVIVPLVRLRDGGPARRAVALSGVAVLLMGGINAVATGIAALVGACWILLEAHPSIRWRALAGWTGAVLLATAWIAGPLVLLGKYSPPFLDWIESAAVTTSITDGSATLRGTTDWVAYIATGGGPEWPAGWSLVADRGAVLGTALVAIAGLLGVVAWPGRHRRFLAASVVVGFVLITAPHVVADAPWATGVLADPLRAVLDGVLAPLRNVHKADVWVRLPLSLGVGATVARLVSAARRPSSYAWPARRRVLAAVAAGGAAVALLATASPALQGNLTTGRTFVSVPGYWLDTAGWLDAHAAQTRALVVPGSAFGTYLWGESRDEPLQPYARSPWAVRDAVPLSSAGNIRMLDAVESLLSDGRGDPTLAAYLAREGVGYLVVRNDLNRAQSDAPRPSLVHQSLDQSGGFTRVAAFGPLLGGYATSELVADGGIDGTYQAVEVFRVDGAPADQRVTLSNADSLVALQGESESLLGSTPLATGSPAVRTADLVAGLTPAATLVTDSGRRWEVDFGHVHDNRSGTLLPAQAWTLPRPVHDYVVSPRQTGPMLQYGGVTDISASSSRADASSLYLDPTTGPWAAADGSVFTAWYPRESDTAAWWQMGFEAPTSLAGAEVTLSWPFGYGSTSLTITTPVGSRTISVNAADGPVAVPAELGPAASLRLTLRHSIGAVGVTSVTVPGVTPTRSLQATGSGTLVDLSMRDGQRSPCVVRGPTNCLPSLQRTGEDGSTLDRWIATGSVADDLVLTVQPTVSDASGVFAQPLRPFAQARASSTQTTSFAQSARSALDRDPSTAWVASATDRRPTLTLTLPASRRISWLRFDRTLGLAASSPFDVTVSIGGRTFALVTDATGTVRFPATAARSFAVTFTTSTPVYSVDTTTGARTVLPVGLSELVLGEADAFRLDSPLGLPVVTSCGFGPDVTIDGRTVRTRVSMTMPALVTGGLGRAVPCGPVGVRAGLHHVVVASSAAFAPVSLRWGAGAGVTSPTTSDGVVTVTTWTSTARSVDVFPATHARLLELGENANAGWVASVAGRSLTPVVVDGWRQAFVVPAGVSGSVEIDFGPERTFHIALILGAILALLLVVLAVRPERAPSASAPPLVVRPGRGAWLAAAVVAAVVSGPVAMVAAALAVVIARRGRVSTTVMAAVGAVAALVPAAAAPWPSSTSLSAAAAAASAFAVAAGTGLVLGVLVSACWVRLVVPTAAPDARPDGR